MRGILFKEFEAFVEHNLGLDALQNAIDAADLPSGGVFTTIGNYPYSEMEQLLVTILTQNPALEKDAVLVAFGNWLAGRFKDQYAHFFTPHDNAIDFLASIDGHIHTEVRKLDPNAAPPSVKLEACGDNMYRLKYQSHRPLAKVALGLAQGSIEAYGGEWDIVEETRASDDMEMNLLIKLKEPAIV